MKTIIISLTIILFGIYSYGQKSPSPIEYKAKAIPVPIESCSTGKLITYVPLHKKLYVSSYKIATKCYNVQYKVFIGCVNEKWMPDINPELKNTAIKLYLDSLQQVKELITQDSIKRDKINKDQIRLGLGPLPLVGDTLICFKVASLWKDEPPPYDEIFKFKPGQKVKYIDVVTQYYHIFRIEFENKVGLVLRDKLKNKTQYAEYQKELIEQAKKLEQEKIERELGRIEREKERIAEEKAEIASQQKYKNDLIREYGQATANKILQQKIWLGMTDKMALKSWGRPSDINRNVGSWGVHEQWVYGDAYLYFENGILTSWQD